MDKYTIFFFTLVLSISSSLYAGEIVSSNYYPSLKCETPEILKEYFTGVRKIASRYERHTSVVSSESHFRVHYDTTGYHAPDMTDRDRNGIPDYVDSTLVYLEYAWDIEVNQLGYDPPLSDNGIGGGDEIDIYIREFGAGGYGYTEPENTVNGSSSAFITIDNNYIESQYSSKGYDGLRVSTAHELFHTIQFRYITDFSISWWMEQSAVWMEEQVWDNVNDYIAYLDYFFRDKNSSLDSNLGNFMYGAALWPIYLSKRYGTDIVKHIWETLASSEIRTISMFNEVIPEGLSAAYNEFALWNYFTKDRANTIDFYPDSDRFNLLMGIDYYANFSPDTFSLPVHHLTSRFIEILFIGVWGEQDALRIKVTPGVNAATTSSLVWYSDPYNYKIHTVAPSGEDIPLDGKWEKAVLITSCTNTTGRDYRFSVDTAILEGVYVENEQPPTFSLFGTYPNPFNPSTTIRFTLKEEGAVSVRVFDIQGQKVDELFEGELTAGEKRILWKPENIAQGVYFVNITTPNGSETTKTLFLK